MLSNQSVPAAAGRIRGSPRRVEADLLGKRPNTVDSWDVGLTVRRKERFILMHLKFKIIMAVCCLALAPLPLMRADTNKVSKVNSNNGNPEILRQIAELQASIDQILALVTPVTPPTPVAVNTTRLLYPYVTNISGFDTGIVISNTGKDSSGVPGKKGKATIYFFQGTTNPLPFTTPDIEVGTSYTNLTSLIAPGFNGYIEVVCDFPFAHGFGFLSDIGARNLAATIPALVLSPQRTNTTIESVGQ